MLYQPSGHKGRTPQRHKYTKGTTGPSNHHQLSPILRDNRCGHDDRDCHTHAHTQTRRTIVPKTVATPFTPAVHQGPTSRRCGHARRRSTPTQRGDAQTTHTHSQRNRAVCPSATHMSTKLSDRTTPDRNAFTAARRQWGPVHHLARTHQTDDKSKER